MNESNTFTWLKLKHKELIHTCYSRNWVKNIRMTDKSRPVNIFHMEKPENLFSNFDFEDADASVHSTYWLQVQFSGINHQWSWYPTLFLLYINDLPDDVICDIAIYANTTLYSKCDQAFGLWQLELTSELQSDLCDTVDWSRKWPVDLNAGKTQLLSFDWSDNTGAIDVKMDVCSWGKIIF